MKLILIRHGESVQNQILHQSKTPDGIVSKIADPELTQLGKQQAKITGLFLANEDLGEIMTSALQRAVATTNTIVEFNTRTPLVRIWPQINEKNEELTGTRIAETMEAFIRRVLLIFRSIVERQSDLTVVGHSAFISVLTSCLLGESLQEDSLVYRNPNCAITRFERTETPSGVVWKMLCQGSVDHLPVELRSGVDNKTDVPDSGVQEQIASSDRKVTPKIFHITGYENARAYPINPMIPQTDPFMWALISDLQAYKTSHPSVVEYMEERARTNYYLASKTNGLLALWCDADPFPQILRNTKAGRYGH